jgi:3-oxoacyl-[acyl-carrier-protein] synthase II
MADRVVVTGMGVVSPIGNNIAEFWEGLCNGRSGIRTITEFDTTDLTTQFAGVVGPVVPEGFGNKELRRNDHCTLYAVEAADQAWRQSGLDTARENPYRCGVLIGSGIGGAQTFFEEALVMESKGPRRLSPVFVPKMLINMPSGAVAMRLGLMGPNKAVVSACASGTHAIGDAAALIRAGKADVMIAGGTEAVVIAFGIAGFAAMRALSRRNDAPEKASRPFDADRDGFVLADGAGIVVLESESHARARGAEILGEVAGMGETCDAFHFAAPREDGSCAAKAIEIALHDAGVAPESVDYYNAHGTSTPANDPMESRALQLVFGDRIPPVSSTKSMTGHLLGAAGGVEALACLLSIRDGIIPPNINYDTPDPACAIPVVANEARETKIAITVSNSLGFGGHNASIVLKKFE